jgi:hypothetical protein
MEFVGLLLLVGGGLWTWITYKPNGAPAGLAAIEFGIAFLLLGGLFSFFRPKK